MRQKKYQEKFKKQGMSIEEFEYFIDTSFLTITDVAMYLGCTRNTVNNYLDGKSKIPHVVKLACELYVIKHIVQDQ